MLAQGGEFADGIVLTEAERAKCRHIVTLDKEFARLSQSGRVLLLEPPGR